MGLSIRNAVPDDAHAIAQVHVESWREAYRDILPRHLLDSLSVEKRQTKWQAVLLQGLRPVLVGEHKQKVVGFLNYGETRDPDRDRNKTAELIALYLAPDYLRSGYGALLYEHARSQMHRQFEEVTAWILEENQPARAFCEHLGFQRDSASKVDHAGDGIPLNEVRYWKKLPEAGNRK